MALVLETPRLLLRDELLEDTDAFLSYRCKECFWRHIPTEVPTRDSIAERIAKFLPEQTANPRHLYFLAAVERDASNVMAEASMHLLPHRSAEIGFAVSDARWGHGLGSEILFGLLSFGFRQLGLHRAFCRVEPSNGPSIRVLRKSGMTCEGVQRHVAFVRNAWWDLAQYSILDHEFPRERSTKLDSSLQ